MAVSLTKEEFLERFIRRKEQFEMVINSQQVRDQLKIRIDSNNIHIDLSQLVGTLIGDALLRIVNLVYQDKDD